MEASGGESLPSNRLSNGVLDGLVQSRFETRHFPQKASESPRASTGLILSGQGGVSPFRDEMLSRDKPTQQRRGAIALTGQTPIQ